MSSHLNDKSTTENCVCKVQNESHKHHLSLTHIERAFKKMKVNENDLETQSSLSKTFQIRYA